MERSCSEGLAAWVASLRFEDLPPAVVRNSCNRVLDVIGLVLAGRAEPFGPAVIEAVGTLHPAGRCRIFGGGRTTSPLGAALANGSLSQALEFDDTHNESIVHMSSPSVAAALALADEHGLSGREVILGVAIGNEISCRIGSIAPAQFHRRGFHPTGIFAPFGIAFLAGRLLGLDQGQLVNAAGIVGSFAAGLLECWVDGTQSKFLHPGWAAQSGIAAATLGRTGATGPRTVIEGRFGLIASHLQDESFPRDFGRVTEGLGRHWESERASFKPFPVAHVSHPYIDALLRLRARHRIDPARVRRIEVPVASYIVGIVCEPLAEKRRPLTDSHGRVSLQYTLAEALVKGRIGRDAYRPDSLSDPLILGLADRVEYRIDPAFPGPERFKGQVLVEMEDGSRYEEIEEHNRGSAANPMSDADIDAKFADNAGALLPHARIAEVARAARGLPGMAEARALIDLTLPE